jgi:hypothetical protein
MFHRIRPAYGDSPAIEKFGKVVQLALSVVYNSGMHRLATVIAPGTVGSKIRRERGLKTHVRRAPRCSDDDLLERVPLIP